MIKTSHTPHFKLTDNDLSQFISSFPNEVSGIIIDDQANLFVNIITTSASSFFSITEKSTKERQSTDFPKLNKRL